MGEILGLLFWGAIIGAVFGVGYYAVVYGIEFLRFWIGARRS